MAAALFVVVHTEGFRRFVLQKIEDEAASSLGARLNIERVAIDWRPLELDLYGIEMRGRESSAQAPLFAAEHLRIGLKIISILRAKVDFREIVLDQPVAHLYVDAKGNSNLPQAPSADRSGTSSPEATVNNLLNLAIQHLEINSGRLFYNDEEVPMSAEFANFRAQVDFNPLVRDYHGTLAYADGRVTVKNYRPVEHGLQMAFFLGRDGAQIDPITITAGESTLKAQARLTNYQDPHLSGTYESNVSTTEVLRIADSKSIASGFLGLTGNFAYHSAPAGEPWFNGVELDGKMAGRQLRVSAGKKDITADSLSGDYRLLGGDLYVRNLQADALGGRFDATYDLLRISGNSASRLEGSIENASLERMNDVAAADKLAAVRLVGRVDGTVRAAWTSRIQDAVARLHVVIRNPGGAVAQNTTLPLSGLIDVDYDGARQYASFGNSYLKTGNTTASVTGILSKDSRLNAKLETADLHEFAELASVFEQGNSGSGNPAWLSELRGSARFQGQVLGSPSNPRVQGELFANNLEIQKTRWRALHVNLPGCQRPPASRCATERRATTKRDKLRSASAPDCRAGLSALPVRSRCN